jgi:hypothetical protein
VFAAALSKHPGFNGPWSISRCTVLHAGCDSGFARRGCPIHIQHNYSFVLEDFVRFVEPTAECHMSAVALRELCETTQK